jgi:hypothetical protein
VLNTRLVTTVLLSDTVIVAVGTAEPWACADPPVHVMRMSPNNSAYPSARTCVGLATLAAQVSGPAGDPVDPPITTCASPAPPANATNATTKLNLIASPNFPGLKD